MARGLRHADVRERRAHANAPRRCTKGTSTRRAKRTIEPTRTPHLDQNDTASSDLARGVHLLETVSVVGEVSPRIYGYRPDAASWSVGIEKLTHGHVLQLNFGNSFGTTPGQVARGGSPHDVYHGIQSESEVLDDSCEEDTMKRLVHREQRS